MSNKRSSTQNPKLKEKKEQNPKPKEKKEQNPKTKEKRTKPQTKKKKPFLEKHHADARYWRRTYNVL
jgi:hypothetical protein